MVGVKRFTDEEWKERERARQKVWRDNNKEHRQAYGQKWRQDNKEHVVEYAKVHGAEYTAREEVQFAHWMRSLHRNYKMTPEDFNVLWVNQEGRCAICKNLMAPKGRQKDAVCVDHNHATGEVRGLLCRGCNHGIGHLKDDPEVLRNAARYLEERGSYRDKTSHLKGNSNG